MSFRALECFSPMAPIYLILVGLPPSWWKKLHNSGERIRLTCDPTRLRNPRSSAYPSSQTSPVFRVKSINCSTTLFIARSLRWVYTCSALFQFSCFFGARDEKKRENTRAIAAGLFDSSPF